MIDGDRIKTMKEIMKHNSKCKMEAVSEKVMVKDHGTTSLLKARTTHWTNANKNAHTKMIVSLLSFLRNKLVYVWPMELTLLHHLLEVDNSVSATSENKKIREEEDYNR
jgi:hypothetical protein